LQRISHTFSLHCQTTDSASLGVPIELALPIMDVQAELTWMAGYIQKWFWPTHLPVVICPSTSWARCRLISLIRPNDVTD